MGGRHSGVVNRDREVFERAGLPWEEEQFHPVEVELDMTEPSDLVYREKRAEPWGTPVERVQNADTDPLHVTW
jgi:hypothetical protein